MPKTVIPTLRYRDAVAAIDFLQRAFGFERGDVHRGEDGQVHHAELRFGDGWVMLGTARDDGAELPPRARARRPLYVVADDVDALHDRAVAAGARDRSALGRHRLRLAGLRRARPGGQRLELPDLTAPACRPRRAAGNADAGAPALEPEALHAELVEPDVVGELVADGARRPGRAAARGRGRSRGAACRGR